MSFETLGLHPDLLRAVHDLGFKQPTQIQTEAIPPALAGRDLLACAMTGSGKTAAFVLPTLQHLQGTRRPGPRALVLTPTRELAAQVADDLRGLAARTNVRGAPVFGGVGMRPQERAFRGGADVLVATPGRLLDHLRHSYARLDRVEVLVLDEADRMLDMGFLPDIRRILRHVPVERQTLFFSATMPPEIARLAQDMLQDPVRIAVERRAQPATGVRQRVFPVLQSEKPSLLLELLEDRALRSVLIFTRTRHRADRLARFLDQSGVPAARIHGSRSQSQRQSALDAFRRGAARILVATDIAARGIDVDDLSHVINFDVPHVPDDYIHRVGRTARAERTGDAFTFVSPEERGDLADIEKALGRRIDRAEPWRGGAPAPKPRRTFHPPAAPGRRVGRPRGRRPLARSSAAGSR